MIGRFLGAVVVGVVGVVGGLIVLEHFAPATTSTVAWVATVARHAVATVTRGGGGG